MPGPDGKARPLHVVKEKFELSVHAKRRCVECHTDITEIPHKKTGRCAWAASSATRTCGGAWRRTARRTMSGSAWWSSRSTGISSRCTRGRGATISRAPTPPATTATTRITSTRSAAPARRLAAEHSARVRQVPREAARDLHQLGAWHGSTEEGQSGGRGVLRLPHDARYPVARAGVDEGRDHAELRQLPYRKLSHLHPDVSRAGASAGLRVHRQVRRLP